MPKLRTTTWDAELARRLYDKGATFKHIGEQVGAAASLVSQFASCHWPARDQAMADQPGGRKRDGPRPLPPGRATLPPLPSLSVDPSHSGSAPPAPEAEPRRPTRPPLWLCVHEAAHAIARFALDEDETHDPGPHLEFVSVIGDGRVRGRAMMQRRQHVRTPLAALAAAMAEGGVAEWLGPRNAECDIIELLAGPVAEHRQRGGWLRPALMEPDVVRVTLELDDPQADVPDDSHNVRRSLDWLAPDDPAVALRDLWRRAFVLVEQEFSGILATARLLRTAGEIEGEEFEASWRACRPSEALRRRRGATAVYWRRPEPA